MNIQTIYIHCDCIVSIKNSFDSVARITLQDWCLVPSPALLTA